MPERSEVEEEQHDGSSRQNGRLPKAKLIRDQQSWEHCWSQLRQEPRLAVDLEANSMFAYQERTCLIQISIPSADYIVDPLAVPDLDGLGELMADDAVEKVFHAAEYDLLLMTRDYNWELNNLFDTMWAARILGYSQLGLAGLLERFFGVKLSKRFQKSNWCKRPLQEAQLAYAQTDTHYLLDLRDILEKELQGQSRWDEAQELFAEQTRTRPTANGFNPDGFWNLHGAYDLTPQQRSVLRAIYAYRDEEAKRRDVPHFKVFNDRTMMAVAEAMPVSAGELYDVDGISPSRNQRSQRRLLSVIAEAREAQPPKRPKRNPRPPESVLDRYEQLHTWRKEKGRERGVESDVIMSRDALWAIAQANPQSKDELASLEVMGPWRLKTYATNILQVLQESDS
ncbi:MAG: HRDC domain-containing protein [Chloroflexota bacterium]